MKYLDNKEILDALKRMKKLEIEEAEVDSWYDDSVNIGCECGCGGDTWGDSLEWIWEEREALMNTLTHLGYDLSNLDVDLKGIQVDNED